MKKNIINLDDKSDFIEYVWSFYGSDDPVYPIQGLTKEMIVLATAIYLILDKDDSRPEMNWGDGDSIDREHVRNIILEIFDLKWEC